MTTPPPSCTEQELAEGGALSAIAALLSDDVESVSVAAADALLKLTQHSPAVLNRSACGTDGCATVQMAAVWLRGALGSAANTDGLCDIASQTLCWRPLHDGEPGVGQLQPGAS